MVKVVLLGSPVRGFYAAGHAGYGAHGQDIVCAGVSTLTQTVYRALRRQGIRARVARNDANGMLCVLAHPKPGQEQTCAIIFATLTEGLSLLETNYPAYVRAIHGIGGGNHDV